MASGMAWPRFLVLRRWLEIRNYLSVRFDETVGGWLLGWWKVTVIVMKRGEVR